MTSALQEAFNAVSPRLNPRRAGGPATIIHVSVFLLWIILFARAFFLQGWVAWSIGVAYIVYDTLLLMFVAARSISLVKPPVVLSRTEIAAGLPTLGVIVASHNEASVLPITLKGLFEQIEGPAKIVIADDGSSDGTALLLNQMYGIATPEEGQLSVPSATHPHLYWLRLPHGGKARALNVAIDLLDTDIIMTVDADTRLADDAVLAMRSAFLADPKLVAATGILVPICAKTFSGRLMQAFQTYEYIRNFIARFAWMNAHSLLLVSGAFASFRRDALRRVGGFDPHCLTEDYELIHRLHRFSVDNDLGWQVRVLGNAQALTDAPGTLGSFMRQRRRWFAGFLQTQYWNQDMVGNRRYRTLGTLMLPVKSFDTVQPLYGLTAFVLLLMFLVERHGSIVIPIFSIISLKIVIDFAYHLWTVHLYQRWTGGRAHAHMGLAILIALVEPFSFQLLRHISATWGWLYFLSGGRAWGRQHRTGLTSAPSED